MTSTETMPVKLIKIILTEVLQNHQFIKTSSFKKIFIEQIKDRSEYPDGIAVNLRWGRKSNYDYICCHVEKKNITFPHYHDLDPIFITDFLSDQKRFLFNIAYMLMKPLHTDVQLKITYGKTLNLYNGLQRKKTLGQISVQKNYLDYDLAIHTVRTEYFVDNVVYYSSGIDFIYHLACIKSVMEAIEWQKIAWHRKKRLIHTTARQLSNAVNPNIFKLYDWSAGKSQYGDRFSFSETDTFYWEKLTDFNTGKKVYIPAQCVYTKYQFGQEKIIRIPVSTGAACHFDYQQALLKGLLELIERDNFSLHYLTKMSPVIITYESDKTLKTLIDFFQKALKIKIFVLDFSYDFPVYAIGVIFLNQEKQRVMSIGLGCDFDLQATVKHALLEAYKAYQSFHQYRDLPIEDINFDKIKSLLSRNQSYWFQNNPFADIKFLFRGKNKEIGLYSKSNPNMALSEKVGLLTKSFKKKQYHLFVKQFTDKNSSYHVVKVISPQFVPLPLFVDLPFLKTDRIRLFAEDNHLRNLKLNTIPPPFY